MKAKKTARCVKLYKICGMKCEKEASDMFPYMDTSPMMDTSDMMDKDDMLFADEPMREDKQCCQAMTEKCLMCKYGSIGAICEAHPELPPCQVPEGAVVCDKDDPQGYCDCGNDCFGNPQSCQCSEAAKCCKATMEEAQKMGISTKTVTCPGKSAFEYCDCQSDCTNKPEYCSCDEAKACCAK